MRTLRHSTAHLTAATTILALALTACEGDGPDPDSASGALATDPATWATGYWTPELATGADDF